MRAVTDGYPSCLTGLNVLPSVARQLGTDPTGDGLAAVYDPSGFR